MPAIITALDQVVADMEDLDKSDDPRKKYTLAGMQAEKEGLIKQLFEQELIGFHVPLGSNAEQRAHTN